MEPSIKPILLLAVRRRKNAVRSIRVFDRPAVRNFFRWTYSGWVIALSWGSGLAALGLALGAETLHIPISPIIALAYAFLVAAFIWSAGGWVTSDVVARSNPQEWDRARKRSSLPRDYRRHAIVKWIVPAGLALLLALSIWGTHELVYQVTLARSSDYLVPAGEPSPDVNCAEGLPNDAVAVYLGGLVGFGQTFPHHVLLVKRKDRIVLERNDRNQIGVDVDIFGEDKKLLATIEKNHFTVIVGNVLDMRRPDPSTLIVRDQYKNEVLNIRYVNAHAIVLSGTFWYPEIPRPIVVGQPEEHAGCFGNFGMADISIQ